MKRMQINVTNVCVVTSLERVLNSILITFLSGHCTAISQAFSVNSPRWRIRGERAGNASLLPSDHVTLGTKGPTIWLRQVYISLQEFFLSKSVCWIFFSEITHTPSPPPCQVVGPCNWMSSCFWHTGRGVLPYKRLMGMCRWMGSHFHDWIDYNGVAFSIELLEWGRTCWDFWGVRQFFIFTVSKRTRMFVALSYHCT